MCKKRIAMIISVIVLNSIGLSGCQVNDETSLNGNQESIVEIDQDKFVVDQSIFRQIKDDQTLKLQDKNDVFKVDEGMYYVYFTTAECPFCEMLDPIIEYYTVKFNQPKIYFVDGDQCKELDIFIKENDKNLTRDSGYTLSGVPSMLVIEDGELKESLTGIELINDELKRQAIGS